MSFIKWCFCYINLRWHFAYNCVLEDHVQRRRKMWSWPVIQQHRKTCRAYKANYKKKLGLKKVPNDLQKELEVGSVGDI